MENSNQGESRLKNDQLSSNQSIQNQNNLYNPLNNIQNQHVNSEDLKKALIFLLGKELKDFSLEKKKEYLSKKISQETLEKALELYPIIEANTNSKIEEFISEYEKKNSKKGFFDGLFDLGVLTTVVISTLGINYLLDLQRNKKNEIFYREAEKKLNEELKKVTENMKKEITNELSNFCNKNEVDEKIKEKISLHNQNSGLNLNLSSKNMKDNINNLKFELSSQEQKLKEISVKMENNSVLLKQEVINQISNLVEENNKKLLMQIIELQNKLIISNSSNSKLENVNIPGNKNSNRLENKYNDNNENVSNQNQLNKYNEGILSNHRENSELNQINFKKFNETKIIENTNELIFENNRLKNENLVINESEKYDDKMKQIGNYFNSAFANNLENENLTSSIIENKSDDKNLKDVDLKKNINLENKQNVKFSSLINNEDISQNKTSSLLNPQSDDSTFNEVFNKIIQSLDENKKKNFILQIKNNFMAILDNLKNEESYNSNLNKINLSNSIFKMIKFDLMLNLLEKAGFNKESQYKFTFLNDKITDLEKALETINLSEINFT